MSVYSTLLWQGPVPTSNTVVYTVPAGITAVVRDAEWFNVSGGALSANVSSIVSGFSNAVPISVQNLASGASQQWKGRAVFPAGSQLEVVATGTGLYLVLSAYQLS